MNVTQISFMLVIVFMSLVLLVMWWMHRSVLSLTKTFENMDNQRDKTTHSSEPISNKIGVVSMMKDPKDVEKWLQHHRETGVQRFYIRLEETPEKQAYLETQEDVVLTVGASAGINEYDEIQVRQRKMVDDALAQAALDGMDWLIHIDADELLVGDLLGELEFLPMNVRTFWMDNIEAVYQDVPLRKDTCFQAFTFRECNQPGSECKSYANGKGGGRVSPDVQSFGPHRFKSHLKEADEVKLQGVIVQHFESCDYDQYKKKYKRLAVSDTTQDIPFSYYRDSIDAAKTGDEEKLRCVYEKHRTLVGLETPNKKC